MTLPIAYCPNCGIKIALEASNCDSCGAQFGEVSAWRPQFARPSPNRPSFVAGVSMVTVSIGLLINALLSILVIVGIAASDLRDFKDAWPWILAAALVLANVVCFVLSLRFASSQSYGAAILLEVITIPSAVGITLALWLIVTSIKNAI